MLAWCKFPFQEDGEFSDERMKGENLCACVKGLVVRSTPFPAFLSLTMTDPSMDDIDRLYADITSSEDPSLSQDSSEFSIHKLHSIVDNERFAPELLEFNPLVERFLNRVNDRELEITQQQNDREMLTAADTSAQQIKAYEAIQLLELDKIRYLLSEYYRIRRQKIELYCHFLLHNGNEVLLSAPERKFAKSFFDVEVAFYKRSFQEAIRDEFWTSEEFATICASRKPNLDQFVFLTVPESVGQVQVEAEEGNSVILKSGDIFVFSYKKVRDLMKQGQVQLV